MLQLPATRNWTVLYFKEGVVVEYRVPLTALAVAVIRFSAMKHYIEVTHERPAYIEFRRV